MRTHLLTLTMGALLAVGSAACSDDDGGNNQNQNNNNSTMYCGDNVAVGTETCDGIADELINALCCVRGLRVASRTSSFQYKGRAADVREIGRALGVGAVLDEPRLGRAGIEIAVGDEGVVLERLEIRCTVGGDVVRVAHRPAIRREVDNIQKVRRAESALRIR